MKLFNIFCPMDSEYNSVVKVIQHLLNHSKKTVHDSIVISKKKNHTYIMFQRKQCKFAPCMIRINKTGMGTLNITNAVWRAQQDINFLNYYSDVDHKIKDIQPLLIGYCGAVDPDYHVGELLRVSQVLNLNDHFIKYGLFTSAETIDSFWSNPYQKEKDMLDTFLKRPAMREAVTMESPFLVNSPEHKKAMSRYADIVDQESYSFIQTLETIKECGVVYPKGNSVIKIQEPQILRLVSDAVDEPFDYNKQQEYSKMLRHKLYKTLPDLLGL